MTSIVKHGVRIYERARRSSSLTHLLVRGLARLAVRGLAYTKRFHLPAEQPYNYRYLLDLYEPGTTKLVKQLLKPGMVAVDVGAHVGYYTRLFARRVGPPGKVYSFEPDPRNFLILSENAKGFPNISTFNLAVLDEQKFVVLYESINSGGNSVWPANTRGGSVASDRIKAVALDDVLDEESVHLVKIDVEGAEPEVLKGMKRLLSRSPNISVIVEWNPSCLAGRGMEGLLLFKMIRSFGLSISAIDEVKCNLALVDDFDDLCRLLDRGNKYINLLCTKES